MTGFLDDSATAEPILATDVIDRMMTAHATLALLPVSRWPAGCRAMIADVAEAEGVEGNWPRPTTPSAAALNEMRQVLAWFDHLPATELATRQRLALHLRSLPSPATGRPMFSWPDIGARLGCSGPEARTMCLKGVMAITNGINRTAVTKQERAA